MTARLSDGDTERNRNGKPHAAQHVEILRPLTARPKVKIGISYATNDCFVVLEVGNEPLRQLEAVHHLGVVRPDRRGRFRAHGSHPSNTLPPVSNGDRMKVTGACVATACLIERSTVKASSSWRVTVTFSTASELRTGRIVLYTRAWPRLNSPSVPRSDTNISAGICEGTTSEASALGIVPKPLVCINTAPRIPPIHAPVTMPRASSSRVVAKAVK